MEESPNRSTSGSRVSDSWFRIRSEGCRAFCTTVARNAASQNHHVSFWTKPLSIMSAPSMIKKPSCLYPRLPRVVRARGKPVISTVQKQNLSVQMAPPHLPPVNVISYRSFPQPFSSPLQVFYPVAFIILPFPACFGFLPEAGVASVAIVRFACCSMLDISSNVSSHVSSIFFRL